jgi:hypothetical protein
MPMESMPLSRQWRLRWLPEFTAQGGRATHRSLATKGKGRKMRKAEMRITAAHVSKTRNVDTVVGRRLTPAAACGIAPTRP